MAIGNREVTDLPLLSALNAADLYAVKADQDYRVKVGGPNGLPYLDTAGRLASEFLQPNLATFDPNSKLDVANYNWNTLPNKPTYFPTDWASISGKPSFHAVATSGNYADLNNKPTTMAPTAHTHAAGDITTGTFANARIAAGNVTQHQGALAIGWGQLTGVPSTFPPSPHNHNAGDVTSGVFDVARIPDIAQSKVTGLATALAAKANASNTVTTDTTQSITGTKTFGAGTGSAGIYVNGGNVGGGAGSAVFFQHGGVSRSAIGDYSAITGTAYDGRTTIYSPDGIVLQHETNVLSALRENGGRVWTELTFNPATKVDTVNPISSGSFEHNTSVGRVFVRNGRNNWNTIDSANPANSAYAPLNFETSGLYHNGSPILSDAVTARVVKLTQAAYDALGTKDANTLYAIVG